MAKNYRTVIMCDVNNDGNIQYFEADIEKPVNIDAGIDVTSHPTANGDVIADHMIIQPKTMSLSGSFALSGNRQTNFSGANGRLTNIQKVFEYIMENGLFCSVATLSKTNSSYQNAGNVRFQQRDNMIIKNIHWTQGNTTLDFNFSFQEVLKVNVDEALYRAESDENLPILTSVNELSFSEELLDIRQLYTMLIAEMWDADLLSSDFVKGFIDAGQVITDTVKYAYLAIGIVGLVVAYKIVGSAATAIIAGTASLSTAFPPAIVATVVAIVALALAALFANIAKWFKQMQYKIKAFETFKTDAENAAEYRRFVDFTSSVVEEIRRLDEYCKVYGIVENTAQDCALVIDNTYYIFRFEKNNTSNEWSLKIYDYEDNLIGCYTQLPFLTNISQCTPHNHLFETPSGMHVYLMNGMVEYLTKVKADYLISELNAAKNDLTNYKIFVTPFDMTEFNDMLLDIMKNALEA